MALSFKGIPIIHAERVIPHGHYCYSNMKIINNPGFDTRITMTCCMFWRTLPGFPDQQSGWCDYLKTGDMIDDETGTMLLWDQVKECSINRDYDE